MRFSKFIHSFSHIFFPKVCCGCNEALLFHEEVLCLDCIYHLPLTDFHIDLKNESAKQLWGKLDVYYVTSMLYLSKSSCVELLMHKLKFKGYPEIGEFLGTRYGITLCKLYQDMPLDFIVPIPLHSSKMRKRGYNHAECFARGLEKEMKVPLLKDVLIRQHASASQTTKSRLEIYDNVEQVFALVGDYSVFKDKHVLLVDDVLTTGATICSAGNLLKQVGARVSIATIARA